MMIEDEVRHALDRILKEDSFVRSRRNTDLLRHLVTQKLEGRGESLNGTTIAQDVFEKGSEFDPTTDPSVRVQMGRLRKALETYYDSAGAADAVRINLPKGTYEPSFEPANERERNADAPAMDARPAAPLPVPAETAAGGAIVVTDDATPAEKHGKRPFEICPPLHVEGETPPGAFRPTRHFMRARPRSTLLIGLVAASVLLSIGAIAHFLIGRDGADSVREAQLNAYPVVVVTPFENRTDDSANDVLRRGFQRQFAADLQRFRTARVALDEAPPSGAPGMRARADYIVSGSILQTDPALDVLTYLIDVDNAEIVDTERLTLEAGQDYATVIEDFSRTLSGHFGGSGGLISRAVEREEIAGAVPMQDGDLAAFRCWTAFNNYIERRTVRRFKEVRDCLNRESAKRPEDATLLAALAWTLLSGSSEARLINPPTEAEAHNPAYALELAEKAVAIDPGNDIAHTYLGLIQWFNGFEPEALASMRRATRLNPADPSHRVNYATFLGFNGEWDKALRIAREAIAWELDPPPWFFMVFFHHAVLTEDADRVAELLQEGAARGDPFQPVYQLTGAVMNDNERDIEQWKPRVEKMAEMNQGDPLLGVRRWLRSPALVREYEKHLRSAGVEVPISFAVNARF